MTALDIVYNNLIVAVIFFLIYSALFTADKNHFIGANNYIDILYMTTSTQSSLGYANVIPNSNITKLIASLHHIIIIFIIAHFVFHLTKHKQLNIAK